MRTQSRYLPDLFPWCARPIMQMCAIRSTSWTLQASAYFILAHAARLVTRTAQIVHKSPYKCTICRQTLVTHVGISCAPYRLCWDLDQVSAIWMLAFVWVRCNKFLECLCASSHAGRFRTQTMSFCKGDFGCGFTLCPCAGCWFVPPWKSPRHSTFLRRASILLDRRSRLDGLRDCTLLAQLAARLAAQLALLLLPTNPWVQLDVKKDFYWLSNLSGYVFRGRKLLLHLQEDLVFVGLAFFQYFLPALEWNLSPLLVYEVLREIHFWVVFCFDASLMGIRGLWLNGMWPGYVDWNSWMREPWSVMSLVVSSPLGQA